jgi:hypothetical protein
MDDAQPDFDSPWKEALDHELPAFLELLYPDIHTDVEWSVDVVALDAELRQLELPGELAGAGVIADRLIRLHRSNGDDAILHVEVTLSAAANFARRMSIHNDRASDKFGLPVVSLAVLGDDSPTWFPGAYEQRLWGTRKRFEFASVKLLAWVERQEELLVHANPIGWLIVAHLQARRRLSAEERRAWRVRLWRRQREAGFDAEARRRWERYFEWLLPLPPAARNQMMAELSPEERRTNVSLWDALEESIRTELTPKIQADLTPKIQADLTPKIRADVENDFRAESVRLGMQILYGQADEALLRRLAELNSAEAYRRVLAALVSRSDLPTVWAALQSAS